MIIIIQNIAKPVQSVNPSINNYMVRYRKGHKNSKGEKAEWCIVSHETGKVLSSHKSKSAAEKHLGDMHKFKHMTEDTELDSALDLLRENGYVCELPERDDHID